MRENDKRRECQEREIERGEKGLGHFFFFVKYNE